MLGIQENNIAGPDFDTYELKSARKSATSMLTLFTKVPQPKGANALLLEHFGYKERPKKDIMTTTQKITSYVDSPTETPEVVTSREKELHVTVVTKTPNSVGLWLERKGEVIYIANKKGVKTYYEEEYLKQAFEKKYSHKLIYVLAENIRERGKPEQFKYNEIYLLDGFSFAGFTGLLDKGVVKLDIRLGHYADGRPHDHGTGFRVFPRDLPKCFENMQRII